MRLGLLELLLLLAVLVGAWGWNGGPAVRRVREAGALAEAYRHRCRGSGWIAGCAGAATC